MAAAAITPCESETASSPLRFPGVSFIRHSSAHELKQWPPNQNLTMQRILPNLRPDAILVELKPKVHRGHENAVHEDVAPAFRRASIPIQDARLKAGATRT